MKFTNKTFEKIDKKLKLEKSASRSMGVHFSQCNSASESSKVVIYQTSVANQDIVYI